MDKEAKEYKKVREPEEHERGKRRRRLPFRMILLFILFVLGILVLTVAYGIGKDALLYIFVPALVCTIPFTLTLNLAYKTASKSSVRHMKRFTVILFALMSIFASSLASIYFSPFVVRYDFVWNLTPEEFPIQMAAPLAIYGYFYVCVWIQFCALSRPKLRSFLYNLVISWPATIFYSTIVLSIFLLPWVSLLNLAMENLSAYVMLLPPTLAFLGMFQSLLDSSWVEVDIDLRETLPQDMEFGMNKRQKPRRLKYKVRPLQSARVSSERDGQRIRVVQITDPHLGPFVSVKRLRNICKKIVEIDPDYVFLTGDYYTLESEHTPHSLYEALEPLKDLAKEQKVFACHGNHDIDNAETEQIALNDLKRLGARVLDEETITIGDAHDIQLIGATFYFSDSKERILKLCDECKSDNHENQTRILLLHNPKDFSYLPEDEDLLVFSGHTHGGMLGLLSLGLKLTFVGLFTADHGLWHFRGNRLYVHRGQGTRFLGGNFMTRVGVPNELSVFNIIKPYSLHHSLNLTSRGSVQSEE